MCITIYLYEKHYITRVAAKETGTENKKTTEDIGKMFSIIVHTQCLLNLFYRKFLYF